MTWVDVYGDDDLWEGEMVAVDAAGRQVLLIRGKDGLCAYSNICPHKGTPLDTGILEDGVLTCSSHNWSFDAATGNGVNPKKARLTRYEVCTENGRIHVKVV